MISWNIINLESVASTNLEIKNIPDVKVGTVVVAKSQTSGRGRHGRKWVSEEGNLFASFLLPIHQSGKGAQLGFLLSLAVANVIDAKLKWPNDILLDGKKCGGVLLENFVGMENVAIAGIGININSFPDDVMFPATSLKENGIEMDGAELLAKICSNLSLLLSTLVTEGFSEIRSQWLKKAAFVGEKIQINLPDGQISGVFKDIDANGAIILVTEGGEKIISVGDVFPI